MIYKFQNLIHVFQPLLCEKSPCFVCHLWCCLVFQLTDFTVFQTPNTGCRLYRVWSKKKLHKLKFQWIRHNYRCNNLIVCWGMNKYRLLVTSKSKLLCFMNFLLQILEHFVTTSRSKFSVYSFNLTDKLGTIFWCPIFIFTVGSLFQKA